MIMQTPLLAIHGLTKVIGQREILTRCNLHVATGEICAIIGPNGAGKTTLFKTIAGLTFPTSGTITLLGQPFHQGTFNQLLGHIGAMIEAPEWRHKATARDVLHLHLDLLNLPRDHVNQTLKRVGLDGAADTPVATFSLGMRQRLALARAIINEPELLVLDEPTNGLDPTAIIELRDILGQLAAQGAAILVASHVLTELEHTAHTVAICNHGQLTEKQAISDVITRHERGLEGFYLESVSTQVGQP